MTAAIATLTTVQNALSALEGRGQKPTIDRIIEELGGGSRGTVVKHLATIRGASPSAHAEAETLLTPETRRAAVDLAETIARAQRAVAEEAFADERRLHLETVAQMVADAQRAGDMLETAERDAARCLARVDELERQLALQSAACLELEERLARATESITTLEQLLSEAEAPKADHPLMSEIASLMRGLDARLAAIDVRTGSTT